MKVLTVFLGAMACTLVPAVLCAHEGGASFEEKVGAHTIDVGYDVERFVAGERVVFDFELLDSKGAPVHYERAWVRLAEGERVVLATGIAEAPVGKTTLLYRMSDAAPSEASISVRFEGKGAPLAEASFPFTVEPKPTMPIPALFVAGIATLVAFIAGAAAGRLLCVRRKNIM